MFLLIPTIRGFTFWILYLAIYKICKIILDQAVINYGIYQKKEILSVMILVVS